MTLCSVLVRKNNAIYRQQRTKKRNPDHPEPETKIIRNYEKWKIVFVLFRSRNIWEHASAILKVLALSRDPRSGVIRLEVFSQFTTEVKQSILMFSETGKIPTKMIKILGKNVTCSKILHFQEKQGNSLKDPFPQMSNLLAGFHVG